MSKLGEQLITLLGKQRSSRNAEIEYQLMVMNSLAKKDYERMKPYLEMDIQLGKGIALIKGENK